jgi:predicted phage terminase large subunit-like protein
MVGAHIDGSYEKMKIYSLPRPVNERLTFPETYDRIKHEARTIGLRHPARVVIEDVAYQQALIQQFMHDGTIHVDAFRPMGDKRSRLALTGKMIENGQILFPPNGAEELIGQITGFGVEKHDDLADAFSMLILMIIEMNSAPRVQIINLSGGANDWYNPYGA